MEFLPVEVLLTILVGLPDTDILRLGQVNRRFRSLITDTNFWSSLLTKAGGSTTNSTIYNLRRLCRRATGQLSTAFATYSPEGWQIFQVPDGIVDILVVNSTTEEIYVATSTAILHYHEGKVTTVGTIKIPQSIQRPHFECYGGQPCYIDNAYHQIITMDNQMESAIMADLIIDGETQLQKLLSQPNPSLFDVNKTRYKLKCYRDRVLTPRSNPDEPFLDNTDLPYEIFVALTILDDKLVRLNYVSETEVSYGPSLLENIVKYEVEEYCQEKLVIILRADGTLFLLYSPRYLKLLDRRVHDRAFSVTKITLVNDEVCHLVTLPWMPVSDFIYRRIDSPSSYHCSGDFIFYRISSGWYELYLEKWVNVFFLSNDLQLAFFDFEWKEIAVVLSTTGRLLDSEKLLDGTMTEIYSRYEIDELYSRCPLSSGHVSLVLLLSPKC